MAVKFIQNMIYQFKDSFDRAIGMIDEGGMILSYSNSEVIEENVDEIIHSCNETGRPFFMSGYTFVGSGAKGRPDFICFVKGEDDTAARYAQILYVTLSSVKTVYDERHDKNTFIKRLLLDNILPGDVGLKSKELHLSSDVSRAVFLVRAAHPADHSFYETLQNIFPEKSTDFVINLDEHNCVLVKEVKSDVSPADIDLTARIIIETLNSELLLSVSIGIGSIAHSIKHIARAYKEANIALEVGKVFDTEKPIISYDNLGIGRIIYQLPTTLCDMFLSEVFKKESIDVLDSETIFTIQKFFENNLNVSETSRQLYVHRNTLVYRLDKVQKLTGLDLRVFDHAIVFKVAMMVKKYLVSNPIKL